MVHIRSLYTDNYTVCVCDNILVCMQQQKTVIIYIMLCVQQQKHPKLVIYVVCDTHIIEYTIRYRLYIYHNDFNNNMFGGTEGYSNN